MNLFKYTLLQLMILTVTGQNGKSRNHVGPEALSLGIRMREGHLELIELKRVHRVLANKFLRVWITTDKSKKEFKELNIMKELGPFSFYHGTCRKSAFVLFHKRHELYGVIDVKYYVQGFPIDETKRGHIVAPEYLQRSPNYESLSNRLIRSIDNSTIIRTKRDSKFKVYPELLVAISHDTYTDIERDTTFPRGIGTVIHVLSLYNAADMLFSSVRSVDILLNLAGIVIEGIPNQWDFVSENADLESDDDRATIHSKISKYFWLRQSHFPRHSYDFIMYHSKNVREDVRDTKTTGTAMSETGYDYMFPPHYHKDRYSVFIQEFVSYQHFTTIAHEIGHIFQAKHDGTGPFADYFNVRSCRDSLMAASNCWNTCLQWSPQSEAEFENFFRTSLFYCNLKNYPRSLDVPEPKMIFSAREQCECYHYKSNLGPIEHLEKDGCHRPIKCIGEDGQFEEVPLPMDGTPCDKKKVCWNKKCLKYKNKNQCEAQSL